MFRLVVMLTAPPMSRITTDSLAAIGCVEADVVNSALPSWIAGARTEMSFFVTTADERFYLAVGSQPYSKDPDTLGDPIRVQGRTNF